jgi:hypothetical protein
MCFMEFGSRDEPTAEMRRLGCLELILPIDCISALKPTLQMNSVFSGEGSLPIPVTAELRQVAPSAVKSKCTHTNMLDGLEVERQDI